MQKSKLTRTLLGLFTVALLAISMPGCESSPTDVAMDEIEEPNCFILNGVLHCRD